LGLPVWSGGRVRWLSELVDPKPACLACLVRLSAAWVAALGIRAWCQFGVWVRRRLMARPGRLASGGRNGSRSSAAG